MYTLKAQAMRVTEKDGTVHEFGALSGGVGPQGPAGPQGPEGPQGPKGDPGKDADMAVLNNYALKTELYRVWYGTQAEYDSIAIKDPDTDYNIMEG